MHDVLTDGMQSTQRNESMNAHLKGHLTGSTPLIAVLGIATAQRGVGRLLLAPRGDLRLSPHAQQGRWHRALAAAAGVALPVLEQDQGTGADDPAEDATQTSAGQCASIGPRRARSPPRSMRSGAHGMQARSQLGRAAWGRCTPHSHCCTLRSAQWMPRGVQGAREGAAAMATPRATRGGAPDGTREGEERARAQHAQPEPTSSTVQRRAVHCSAVRSGPDGGRRGRAEGAAESVASRCGGRRRGGVQQKAR